MNRLVIATLVGASVLACGTPEPSPSQQEAASFLPGLGATGGILIRTPPPPSPPPPPPPRCTGVVAANLCTPDGSYPLNAWNDPVPTARRLCFSSWTSLDAHPFAPDITGCVTTYYANQLSYALGWPVWLDSYCSRSCYFD